VAQTKWIAEVSRRVRAGRARPPGAVLTFVTALRALILRPARNSSFRTIKSGFNAQYLNYVCPYNAWLPRDVLSRTWHVGRRTEMACRPLLRGRLTIHWLTASCLALIGLLSTVPAHAQVRLSDINGAACIDPARTCAVPYARFMNGDTTGQAAADGMPAADRSDIKFNVVMGAFITAAGTDIAVSMYQIGRGAARERGFGAPWQDSPVAFAATKSAMTAVFVFGLQRLHKDRPKTALILGIAQTAVESLLVVRSARMP
jgi:hypothetical protein